MKTIRLLIIALALVTILAMPSPTLANRDPIGVGDTVVWNATGGPKIIVGGGANLAVSISVSNHQPGTATTLQTGLAGPARQYADGMNLYDYAKGNPHIMVDPLGTETCKRDVFPGVTVQRIKNAIGHQWLNIRGAYRGFYPVGGKSFPLITSGEWFDELQINPLLVEDPPGSGNIVEVPRVTLVLARGWYDEWDTRRRCSGKLESGRGKDTTCCCATPEQIVDCLLEITKPVTSGLYMLLGGNCVDHSENALPRCCLRKNKQIYFGKPVPTGGTSGS